jgi:hypothetical protein
MTERGRIDEDVARQIRELVEKSLEANTHVAQNSAELLKHLAEGRVDLSELAAKSNGVVKRAVEEYVRLSSAHASRLIDLGVDVSRSILASARPPRTGREMARADMLFDLEVRGKPGELCQTAFFLESDRAESVTSGFSVAPVLDASGTEQKGFEVTLEPSQITMEAHSKERVIVRAQLSPSAAPGPYTSTVSVEARPDKRFRLVMVVEDPGEAAEESGEETSKGETPLSGRAGAGKTPPPVKKAGTRSAGASRPKAKGKSTPDKGSKPKNGSKPKK